MAGAVAPALREVTCTVFFPAQSGPCARTHPSELGRALPRNWAPTGGEGMFLKHCPSQSLGKSVPLHAVASGSFRDFPSSAPFSQSSNSNRANNGSAREKELSEQQLRDFLRGGEDVASIMSQMASLLEDIQGFEDREEALAVEMAAAAAVAGRLEVLDRNFLLALDYMVQEASKIRDSKQVWLLQTLKQQVMVQLETRFPPQVEVVSMLVTTPGKQARLDILRRAVAAASYGANKEKLSQAQGKEQTQEQQRRASAAGAASTQMYTATVTEAVPAGKPVGPALAPEDEGALAAQQRKAALETVHQPEAEGSGALSGGARYVAHEEPAAVAAAAAWWSEDETGEGEEDSQREEEKAKARRKVPAAALQHIIAQADDLIAFMEEELPIRDRRLLARLVLAREEARGMMSGGFLDPRNDVRKMQNLPEAEVRFISQLAAIRNPQVLRGRLLEVLRGDAEGEHVSVTEEGQGPMPYGAPVRPGHFMDSVTKVVAGVYKTGGSGILVQQLERIRKESLDVLQQIGHS